MMDPQWRLAINYGRDQISGASRSWIAEDPSRIHGPAVDDEGFEVDVLWNGDVVIFRRGGLFYPLFPEDSRVRKETKEALLSLSLNLFIPVEPVDPLHRIFEEDPEELIEKIYQIIKAYEHWDGPIYFSSPEKEILKSNFPFTVKELLEGILSRHFPEPPGNLHLLSQWAFRSGFPFRAADDDEKRKALHEWFTPSSRAQIRRLFYGIRNREIDPKWFSIRTWSGADGGEVYTLPVNPLSLECLKVAVKDGVKCLYGKGEREGMIIWSNDPGENIHSLPRESMVMRYMDRDDLFLERVMDRGWVLSAPAPSPEEILIMAEAVAMELLSYPDNPERKAFPVEEVCRIFRHPLLDPFRNPIVHEIIVEEGKSFSAHTENKVREIAKKMIFGIYEGRGTRLSHEEEILVGILKGKEGLC